MRLWRLLVDVRQAKALLRRATARDALQKYDGAEQDLRAVLKLEPHNKQAREDLRVKTWTTYTGMPQTLACCTH